MWLSRDYAPRRARLANGRPVATAGVGTVGHHDGHGWAHVRPAGRARGEPGRRAAVARRREAAGRTGDAPRARERGRAHGAADRGPLGGASDRDRADGAAESHLTAAQAPRGRRRRARQHATGRLPARVHPGQLDAERFEALGRDGREALAPGRPEPAATLLREALALWRGPPLADLAYEPWAPTRSRGSRSSGSAVLEERIEADLRLSGTPSSSASSNCCRGSPLRERLRGQLMLALYRSGRQAEALDVYHETRRALADELGLEPGRSSRRSHGAMLDHEPSLVRSPAAARDANLPRPRRRCSGGRRARGAERDARRLARPPAHAHRARRDRQDTARHCARRDRPRDLQGRRRLRRPRAARRTRARASTSCRRWGRASAPESGRLTLIDQLQDQDLLLILDNFERLLAAAPLVAELLPAAPG